MVRTRYHEFFAQQCLGACLKSQITGLLVSCFLLLAFGFGSASAADLTVGANIGNVPWEFQNADG